MKIIKKQGFCGLLVPRRAYIVYLFISPLMFKVQRFDVVKFNDKFAILKILPATKEIKAGELYENK
jgi:hypothetical protein